MLAANAGKNLIDMPLRAVQRPAALGKVPGEAGKPPLDGRKLKGRGATLRIAGGGARGTGADIEPDHLRARRQGIEASAPAPGGKMPPILGVGVARVLRGGVVAPRGLDQFLDMRRDSLSRVSISL